MTKESESPHEVRTGKNTEKEEGIESSSFAEDLSYLNKEKQEAQARISDAGLKELSIVESDGGASHGLDTPAAKRALKLNGPAGEGSF